MKTLHIKWQRLVDENMQTCPRCRTTEKEINSAVASLRASLAPLGMDVQLEKGVLDRATFQESPTESNRIWISERSLEFWLGATVGQSQCCDTCGDAECRTVVVDGDIYEGIPSELIVKAGLKAAAELTGNTPSHCVSAGETESCSPSPKHKKADGYCPNNK